MPLIPTLSVSPTTADAILRGHPWVWRDGVTGGLRGLSSGDEVSLSGPDRQVLGHGIVDVDSPIAVRMWTQGNVPLTEQLMARRFERALSLRSMLIDVQETTAYRLLNGEGDRCPGVVVDRYGDVAVLKLDGHAAECMLPRLKGPLWQMVSSIGCHTLVWKRSKRASDSPVTLLEGQPCPHSVDVKEYGVPFRVDIVQGQKTGAFLDQRDNRRRVGALARGKRVLNLFSYAGGFSLWAALGGASHVTSVDIAREAHAAARISFGLAGVDPEAHSFVTGDVNQFLMRAKDEGKKWDLVISDPPSFAPSEKAVTKAILAYRKLHRGCIDVLSPGGVFCAASCSSHVDAKAFVRTLEDGALGDMGGRELSLVGIYGQPLDHPVVPAWPEGQYLKFAILI